MTAAGGGWPWRVLDERDPRGGRPKAWLFLTHPGPSLLVTAVTVAAAGLLSRQPPGARTAAGLVLVMLPAQLAIGSLNDWADAAADRLTKPHKPIARGLVSRRDALLVAVAGVLISVATAAWLGVEVLLVDLLGLGAGLAYDLALKRSPAAFLAWWAGFVAVPLLAMVAIGRTRGSAAAVPVAGLLAVALLLANGLPDAPGDRRAGARTLPSLLGETGSRMLMAVTLLAAAALVLLLAGPLGQGARATVAAAVLAAGAALAALPGRARRLLFPLASICVAVAAVSWLATLPAA